MAFPYRSLAYGYNGTFIIFFRYLFPFIVQIIGNCVFNNRLLTDHKFYGLIIFGIGRFTCFRINDLPSVAFVYLGFYLVCSDFYCLSISLFVYCYALTYRLKHIAHITVDSGLRFAVVVIVATFRNLNLIRKYITVCTRSVRTHSFFVRNCSKRDLFSACRLSSRIKFIFSRVCSVYRNWGAVIFVPITVIIFVCGIRISGPENCCAFCLAT